MFVFRVLPIWSTDCRMLVQASADTLNLSRMLYSIRYVARSLALTEDQCLQQFDPRHKASPQELARCTGTQLLQNVAAIMSCMTISFGFTIIPAAYIIKNG